MSSDDSLRSAFTEIAWADFVEFAATQAEIVAEFNNATGRHFRQPRNGLEAMIDQATGKDADDAEAFMLWVTEHYWGMDDAPEAVKTKFQPVEVTK
jgi:hypothetical protein